MNILVYVYNSFDDPLFGANLMTLIHKSKQEGNQEVYHIVTYEQKEYQLSKENIRLRQDALKAHGIFWYPLKWHSSRFILLVKAYDFARGAMLLCRLRFTKSAKWMITMGSVSGSVGFIISRLLGMKQYAYQFEPHSEFLLDLGLMKSRSITYILLNKLETLTGRHAELISTGTDAMIRRLKHQGSKGQIFKLPSAVDEGKFNFSDPSRTKIRKDLGIVDKKVFIYVGKTGGIYYSEELFVFFKSLRQAISNAFFIVLTPQPPGYYLTMFSRHGIDKDSFFISRVAHHEIPAYLSAADLGIVAIPPLKAQQFRSPIKVGEYLLCGLPYITCKGVSEDDIIAEKYEAGVVMKDFSVPEIDLSMAKIKTVLNTDKSIMIKRCREAGIHYRSLSAYYKTYSTIINSM